MIVPRGRWLGHTSEEDNVRFTRPSAFCADLHRSWPTLNFRMSHSRFISHKPYLVCSDASGTA
jgi:hypothetical protein